MNDLIITEDATSVKLAAEDVWIEVGGVLVHVQQLNGKVYADIWPDGRGGAPLASASVWTAA